MPFAAFLDVKKKILSVCTLNNTAQECWSKVQIRYFWDNRFGCKVFSKGNSLGTQMHQGFRLSNQWMFCLCILSCEDNNFFV